VAAGFPETAHKMEKKNSSRIESQTKNCLEKGKRY
jgi:hypothetical protein